VKNQRLFSSPQFLFQTNKATDSYQQLVEQGLPQVFKFLEQHKGYENEHNALSNLRSKTKQLIQSLLQPVEPMGLMTHTDFWCNNLLFKEIDNQPVECSVLDWQMVTYSQPTNDIALLVISSLPAKIRRENTAKLLDLYYKVLRENCAKLGVDIEVELCYSRNKLEIDYK
jgi:aminoglycoside/choline kinase family phosphotransferase